MEKKIIIDKLLNESSYDFSTDFLDNDKLKKIYTNINNFNKLIDYYNNILFICGDYPGYGGAATNCDNIKNYLDKKGKNVKAIYFSFTKEEDNLINYKNITKEIEKYKKFPNLVILKSFVPYVKLKNYFKCDVFYLIGGIFRDKLDKYYYDLNIYELKKKINPLVKKQIEDCDYSFCNSFHTKKILKKLYNFNIGTIYTSFIPYHNTYIEDINNYDFKNNRKYDYGVIISNFDRNIKNVNSILEYLDKKKEKGTVIFIGKNSEKFKKYCTVQYDLIKNINVKKYLKDINNILISSFFESCCNVYVEAFFSGCNIIFVK
jgi:hypothetical protein